jgi:hypothetical protein
VEIVCIFLFVGSSAAGVFSWDAPSPGIAVEDEMVAAPIAVVFKNSLRVCFFMVLPPWAGFYNIEILIVLCKRQLIHISIMFFVNLRNGRVKIIFLLT